MTKQSRSRAIVLASVLVIACSDTVRDGAQTPASNVPVQTGDGETSGLDGSSTGDAEAPTEAEAPDGGGQEARPDADVARVFPSPAIDHSWCASGVRTTQRRCPSGFHARSAAWLGVDAGLEGSLCCLPLEVSEAECAAAGFRVVAEGTQGSLLETGCSDGGKLRAFVPGATARLCCE